MDIIELIVSGLIGAVLGYVFNEFVDYLRKKHQELVTSQNNRNLLEELSNKDYSLNENGIIPLAHGTPFYFDGDIQGYITDKRFYFPIPQTEPIIDKLTTYGFVQDSRHNPDFKYTDDVNCLSDNFWGKEVFDHGFGFFGNNTWDSETKKELEIVAEDVANQFISDLESGKVRFNGAMFGVSSFNPNRSLGEELPTAQIFFYKTDYFTYRVFSQYYLNHRTVFLSKEIVPEMINHLAFPFLTSFGISVIAVISRNHEEEKLSESDVLIVGRRSQHVVVDRGLLHFTMNEAFSCRDTIYNNPSFDLCVSRGFNEELKWTKEIKGLTFSKCKFMDFFFDSNKCEMGLTGYIKLTIDESLSVQKLYELYKESQDGILETEGLEFVEIDKVFAYYQENKNKMSAGFATVLECFLRRYNNDLL